jgi:hypothetical protein
MSRDRDRETRRRSPRFEAMEARQVLSTAAAAHLAAAAQARAAQSQAQVTPSAFLTSDSQTTGHAPGGREVLKTTFSGSANNEGPAQATSTEVATRNRLISVQIVLQTAHGSVRMAFGPSDVTQSLADSDGSQVAANYHIVSGTGAFAHAKGTGSVAFWTLGGDNGWNLTITPNA